MAEFDLVVRGGTVVTAERTVQADIGVRAGKIAAVGTGLAGGAQEIDARGKLVMPGGIDSHCHVEQKSSAGVMCADDFYTATVAAAFGGTTTIIPFAAQHRGDSITSVVDDYAERARKSVVDYAFHLIVSDPTPHALNEELPAMVKRGITSLKIYTTYELLRLKDDEVLDVLLAADRERALVMVHAENHEVIQWIARRLLERGHKAPKFHATSHHPIAESEATHRVIALTRILDVPALIVHVSGGEAIETIRSAQKLGASIHAESCPQYLFLTAGDIDKPGMEGAKFCCSPPPRDASSQETVWRALKDGTIRVYSSDHAPYRYDESGKLPKGDATTFKDMANGVPGIQVRMPLLFSEGVGKGRITLNEFVALTSTNHAQMYGIADRKGTLDVGADADIAIWDPQREVTLTAATMKDNAGYTPYEGRVVKGWPVQVLVRGRMAVDDGKLLAEAGGGEFVPCGTPAPLAGTRPTRDNAAGAFRRLIDS